ncbi:MAG TPA: MFS transporter [Streptosporangiaceae bacterium]|nr:MFS transporter [Streptosporangiaceae bacterium]
MLLAALAVEFVDEFFDGTRSGALPLIKHDLSLSYLQVSLLSAVPLVVGSIVEMPIGVISGTGSRRRRFILAGGLIFIASVLAAGLAPDFAVLLVALTIFFPASGSFVSLSQSALMDSATDRQAQRMVRWTLAGSAGAVAGPLLVAAVLAVGGSWRLAFMACTGCSVLAWLAVATTGRADRASGSVAASPAAGITPAREDDGVPGDDESGWPGWRLAIGIVRSSGALRWLLLLQVSDLLLDVFTTFLALYLVEAVHAGPLGAALGVGVRLGAGLACNVILIQLLERFDSRRVLRASVCLALGLLPAFLLAPGLGAKLMLLALLTLATAPWYPVLEAELFGSLPGRSGLAVSLSSVAGLAGGLGPLAVGLLAQGLGLSWAMTALCVAPVIMLMLVVPAGDGKGSTRLGCRD